MQRRNIFFLAAIAAMLLIPGMIHSQSGLTSEERRVGAFEGLAVAVSGHVYLVQGPEQKLIIEGTERVLDNLITEVRNGQLTIRTPRGWNFRRRDELNVYVTMPEIKNITLSGSARVIAESPVRTESITITISGSGRVEIDDFTARNLRTTISGSGRLRLGGGHSLEKSDIVISGSGRVESARLPAKLINATISGSGSCQVHALSDLNVRISGSGRVVYTGDPLIDARISGSGRIVNAN